MAHREVTDKHVDLSAVRLIVIELAPVTAEGIDPEYTTECLAVNRQATCTTYRIARRQLARPAAVGNSPSHHCFCTFCEAATPLFAYKDLF